MRPIVRSAAKAVLRSRAWKATSQWIRGNREDVLTARAYRNSIAPGADVLFYFPDTKAKLYQLQQWIPVIEELNKTVSAGILLRRPSAISAVAATNALPIVFRRRFTDMITYLDSARPKAIVYVNNSYMNFQALSFSSAVHVHVNHGESDKLSMVSNQVKAYDAVFTAGRAAADRHAKALYDFNMSKLVPVGRPQLDVISPNPLSPTSRKTVMYAPTWEGENDNNNYTSVDKFGRQIVSAVLRNSEYRLIYKPHPRVESSKNQAVAEEHQTICSLIESANQEQDVHEVITEGDILGMFTDVDLMITDVSSVGLDFLYLNAERPLLLTDRRNNSEQLKQDSPIARVVPIINDNTVSSLDKMLGDALERDELSGERSEMRAYYFGDRPVGSSMTAFASALTTLINTRQTKIRESEHSATPTEADDESSSD